MGKMCGFKKTFRISRATFRYILDRIEPILKDISPNERLAICFYRLGGETIIIGLQKWLEEEFQQ